jgi:hypothetical protein
MGTSSSGGRHRRGRGTPGRQWRSGVTSGVGRLGLALCLLSMVAVLPAAVEAQLPIHGIGFSKGCASPLNVGDAYSCVFAAQNTSVTDTALDTLTFNSIVDVVHSGTGDKSSGNILAQLHVGAITGGASCNASGAATGPAATGNTLCTLPSGSSITFLPFSHWNVAATDPNPLTDTAVLTWQDSCSSNSINCPIGNQLSSTASQAIISSPLPPPPPPPPVQQIPTLSGWVMIMLGVFLALVAVAALRKKRAVS